MATAAFHCEPSDQPTAYVGGVPTYRYLAVNVSEGVRLFLPDGPASSAWARRMAAVLIAAADEFDAALAGQSNADAAPTSDVTAEPDVVVASVDF